MTEKQPLETDPYKGVHDYYPDDWSRMLSVFATIRKTLRANGFEEYQASPLERAELYESKTSEEIVNEQTYTFEDRGGRRVTLRPEMTPTLARMIAGKRRELAYPVRWFSIGNRFRYERPQKGRSREFYQADIDIVGLSDSRAEGEAIVMAHAILRAFGATNTDFSIRISSRALLNSAMNALALSDDEMTAYLGILDRKNKMDAAAFETARAPFRRNGTDPLELIEAGTDEATRTEQEKLDALITAFKARGIENVTFDSSIVRGFLYYTGLVFEIYDTHPDNPRALGGGGRYDGLVSLFGGDPLPAMGFAIGIETLMDFLSTHDLLPRTEAAAHVFIGTPTPADMTHAQVFADSLRSEGLRVLVNTSEKGLGDQVREADKRGIPYFFAYGENEKKSGTMKLKELATGKEDAVSEDELVALIRI